MKQLTSLGLIALTVALAPVAHAQYTADFQTNIISGVVSNWFGDYVVGNNAVSDVLVIENGGTLVSVRGYVGYAGTNNQAVVSATGSVWKITFIAIGDSPGNGNSLVVTNGGMVANEGGARVGRLRSNNNRVLISGGGSSWANTNEITVGEIASGNLLVVSNGAELANGNAWIGDSGPNTNNAVVVTGVGSRWTNRNNLTIGNGALSNSVCVLDGGVLVSSASVIGQLGGKNCSVLVGGTGSMWNCQGNLIVGLGASGHSLVVSNGGAVIAQNLTVGYPPTLCDNLVRLDGGSITVTNATGDGTFEVRQGKLLLNGGTLQVDRFVMTNSCAQFIRTGGTLIYGSAVLTTNLDADGDGMVNGWEQAFDLDPFNPANASADNDGDGFTNLQEFQAGTDPTNASSAFRVLSLEYTNNDILVTWQAGGGRTNVVQSAPDLTGTYSNVSPDTILPGPGDVTTNYVDTGGATNGNKFYKIRLVP